MNQVASDRSAESTAGRLTSRLIGIITWPSYDYRYSPARSIVAGPGNITLLLPIPSIFAGYLRRAAAGFDRGK